MKKALAAAAATVAISMPLVATPAAAVSASIDITTTRAVAMGDRYYDTYAKEWRIFRPMFTIVATVVCEPGTVSFISVTPVWAMTFPSRVTCTGSPQTVAYNSVAAPTRRGSYRSSVTATLFSDSVSMGSETQVVRVTTSAKDRYHDR